MVKTKEEYLIEKEKRLFDAYKEIFRDVNKALITVIILSLINLIIYRSIELQTDEIVNNINLLGIFIKVSKLDIIIYLPLIVLAIYIYILGKFSKLQHFDKLIEKNSSAIIESNKDAEPLSTFDLQFFSFGVLGFILYTQRILTQYFSIILIILYFIYFILKIKLKVIIAKRQDEFLFKTAAKEVFQRIKYLTIIDNLFVFIIISIQLFFPLILLFYPLYLLLDNVILGQYFIICMFILCFLNINIISMIYLTLKIHTFKKLVIFLKSFIPFLDENILELQKKIADIEIRKSKYNNELINLEVSELKDTEQIKELKEKINDSDNTNRFYKNIIIFGQEIKKYIEEIESNKNKK